LILLFDTLINIIKSDLMNYPSIQNPSSISIKNVKKALRSRSEDGKPSYRPLWTSTKKNFTLSYNSLSNADYNTLETFFDENQGVEIIYTNHLNSNSYNVIIAVDELEATTLNVFDADGKNCMSVSIQLQEV